MMAAEVLTTHTIINNGNTNQRSFSLSFLEISFNHGFISMQAHRWVKVEENTMRTMKKI